jgi:hypothetical protein
MQPQPKNDAYTVMLTISLVAMIAACILLYQELKRYPSLKPQDKDMRPPAPTVKMDTGGGDAGTFNPPAEGGAPGGADNKATNPGGNPNP